MEIAQLRSIVISLEEMTRKLAEIKQKFSEDYDDDLSNDAFAAL